MINHFEFEKKKKLIFICYVIYNLWSNLIHELHTFGKHKKREFVQNKQCAESEWISIERCFVDMIPI